MVVVVVVITELTSCDLVWWAKEALSPIRQAGLAIVLPDHMEPVLSQ